MGGGVGFVLRMFLRDIFICPLEVAMDLGRCLRMSSAVRPGQVAKKFFRMALRKVSGTGDQAHMLRYVARSTFVRKAYTLLMVGGTTIKRACEKKDQKWEFILL